jgi:hypothetical protein
VTRRKAKLIPNPAFRICPPSAVLLRRTGVHLCSSVVLFCTDKANSSRITQNPICAPVAGWPPAAPEGQNALPGGLRPGNPSIESSEELGFVPSRGRFLARMKFSSQAMLTAGREPKENRTISLSDHFLMARDCRTAGVLSYRSTRSTRACGRLEDRPGFGASRAGAPTGVPRRLSLLNPLMTCP